MPCTSGYILKKMLDRNKFECSEFAKCFSYGKNICDEEKIYQEWNISYLNLRENGGLMWPKLNAVMLFGLVLNALYNILNNEEIMNDFSESTTSSSIGLKAARRKMHAKIIFFCIQSSFYLSTTTISKINCIHLFKISYQHFF